jgi:hypothetical protein
MQVVMLDALVGGVMFMLVWLCVAVCVWIGGQALAFIGDILFSMLGE